MVSPGLAAIFTPGNEDTINKLFIPDTAERVGFVNEDITGRTFLTGMEILNETAFTNFRKEKRLKLSESTEGQVDSTRVQFKGQ